MAAEDGTIGIKDGEEITSLLQSELQLPHPDLRGGTPFAFKNKFSPRQMRALESICDTLIPSFQPESGSTDPAIERFFGLSASQAGIVTEVAGMIGAWTTRTQFILMYLALLLLSTRLGTFLLCGLNSITSEVPYFQAFPSLHPSRREAILLAWSRSVFLKLQMLVKVIKCYTVFKFYSRADERGNNPAWEAMGYQVPPSITEHEDHLPKTLEQRIVDANSPDLHARLKELGCEVLKEADTPYKEITMRCDVVVIGSGSGGSVVAARLAEAGFRVVIVEKGSYYSRRGLSLLEGPSMNAMYEQSGALTTGDGSAILLAATTLGGGSAVNWAASLKTPPHVLREWSQELGLMDRFGGEEYKRAMDSVCSRLGVQELCTEESFQNRVLRAGCTGAGYSVGSIPRNAARDHDCGFCGFGCPAAAPAASRKQSALETWLPDAAAAGTVLLTRCRAERVITAAQYGDGSTNQGRLLRACGVVCRAGNRMIHVEARATVAACGALHTPPLLRRSGLRSPHIGRQLAIHPVVAVWGYFRREDILPGRSYSGGIMTSFSNAGADWGGSGYGCILETPCVHPGTFAVLAPWRSGQDAKRAMLRYPRTATIIVLDRDRGRGRIEEREGKLIVDYPLFSADKQQLKAGTEMALRVLHAAGAEKLGTDCVGGEVFKSGDKSSAEEFVRGSVGRMFQGLSTPIVSAHQMGSCRMGVDPLCSAVDPHCQTWEVEGLFLGDGSVLPTASGVNPMITIQAIAYSTSKYVEQFLRSSG